jgi:hypothetical protein
MDISTLTVEETVQEQSAFTNTERAGTLRYGDPRFYALLEQIAQLHSDKNHDYAETDNPLSNFQACAKLGVCWSG